jgi:hypothetical protein
MLFDSELVRICVFGLWKTCCPHFLLQHTVYLSCLFQNKIYLFSRCNIGLFFSLLGHTVSVFRSVNILSLCNTKFISPVYPCKRQIISSLFLWNISLSFLSLLQHRVYPASSSVQHAVYLSFLSLQHRGYFYGTKHFPRTHNCASSGNVLGTTQPCLTAGSTFSINTHAL